MPSAVHGPKVTNRAGRPVGGTHEWVSFSDSQRSLTWVFDLTFLESNWLCIYGRGCKGVRRELATDQEQGCCSYGAHFNGDEDADRVEAAARRLTSEQWQHFAVAQELGGPINRRGNGETAKTRIVDDACIFLNRPGFEGGVGCALHIGAVAQRQRPLDWKPDTCWQLPFRVDQTPDESGHLTLSLRQWERGDWGASGYQFHWWCTEPEAYVGTRPVYEELRDELRAMIGPSMHERLEQHLALRRATGIQPSIVPVHVNPTRRATPPGTPPYAQARPARKKSAAQKRRRHL